MLKITGKGKIFTEFFFLQAATAWLWAGAGVCAAVWDSGDRLCMGGLSGKGKEPRIQQRRNDKENERFSKDVLRENRKVESDPRED